jgi:iron complex transport system permease protein
MSLLRPANTPLISWKTLIVILCLVLLSVIALLYSLSLGTINIGWYRIIPVLFNDDGTMEARVIHELRLPRTVAGFLVGGMLAQAGALMQVLLRNPLAEPYVLGVSGGASVFALCAMLAGLTGAWINIWAFAGALVSIGIVFGLAHIGGSWNPMRVLLTGVVIAAGWSAIISFILAISPAVSIQGMLFWLMGDLSFARYNSLTVSVLIVSLLASMTIARSLNLMSYGDMQAAVLGVSISQLRTVIYLIASLLTAIAVMQAGGVGFIGLIVPHLVRLLFGSDHRLLLPVSVLMGGSILVIADGLARTIIAPQQLPVGVLTAMIGVPLFLLLLQTTVVKQRP